MESILDQVPCGARAAAIRLRSLGDFVPTTQTPEIPKRSRPDLAVAAVPHPVASAQDKTWSAAGFRAVARHFEEKWGLEPGFVGGVEDYLAAFRAYRVVAGVPLPRLKTPMARASAFGVSAVAIFGHSDLEPWRPWKAPAGVVTARGPIEARPEPVIAALERLKVAA